MNLKSKYNCVFCLTPISKGHFDNQNGKCQRCHFRWPDSMPLQKICSEFGCTEYAEIGKELCVVHDLERSKQQADIRYLNPKGPHGLSTETIDRAIDSNPIYREVRDLLNAQRNQVGYGMTKYPELLNPMSWSMVETLDHKIQEQVDALHYSVMLKQQIIKHLEDKKIEKL